MPTIFVEDQPEVTVVGGLVHVRNVNHHSVWPISLFTAYIRDGTAALQEFYSKPSGPAPFKPKGGGRGRPAH